MPSTAGLHGAFPLRIKGARNSEALKRLAELTGQQTAVPSLDQNRGVSFHSASTQAARRDQPSGALDRFAVQKGCPMSCSGTGPVGCHKHNMRALLVR